ncbi:MAG: DNA translocase FtsK 4TM domain-containing protein [Candidatus Kapabacteria bacterium]|nr:DNA translocase FtsK 4TM domain-containing protein [Candidatus Kapabacteria bacterium]
MKNSLLLQPNEQTSLQTQLRVLGVLTFVLSLFMTITILSYTQSDIQNGSVPFKALFGFIEDIDDFRAKVEISQNKLGLPGSYIATYCVHKSIGYWSLVLSFLLAACTWEVFVNGFLGFNFFRRSFWIVLLAVSMSVLSSIVQATILPTLPTEFTGALSNFIAKSLLIGIGKLGAFLFVSLSILASVANIFTYGLSGLYLSTRKKQEPTIPDDILRAQARYYVDIYSDDEEPIEVLRSTVDVADDIDNQSQIEEEIENSLTVEELPSALVPIEEVEDFDDYSDSNDILQPVEVLESIEEFSLQPDELSQTEAVPYEDFDVITPTIIGSVPVEVYEDVVTTEEEVVEQRFSSTEIPNNYIVEHEPTESVFEEIESEIVSETEQPNEIESISVNDPESIEVVEEETINQISDKIVDSPIVLAVPEEQYIEEVVNESVEEEDIETPISFERIEFLTEEPSNQTIFMPQLGETILPDFEEIGEIELDEDMVDSVMEEFPVVIEETEEILPEQHDTPEETIVVSTPNISPISTEPTQSVLPFEFAPTPTSSKDLSTKTRYLVDFTQESQQSNTALLRAKLESVHIPFSSIEEQDTLLTTKYTLYFIKSFDSIQAQAMHSEVIEALKAPGVVIESYLNTEKSIVVEIPKKNLQEIISAIKVVQPNTKGILPIDFGYKNNGDVIRLDVTECYNILIGGANGTGKTNLLVSMIHSLSKNNDAVSLKYLPIILNTHPYSSVEPIFKHSFAVVESDEQRTIHTTEIHALQAIKALFFETKKRLELFDAERKTTISAYNYLKNPLEQLPYIVTIIDPIEMISAHKESREYLSVILLCGSAVGIHVLAQLKNVPSIDTLLLQRFPCTIASFTNSKTSSRLLLQQSTSAEGLLSSNDFIFNSSTYSQKTYFRFFMSSELKYSSSVQNLRQDSYPYHLPKIEQKEQVGSKNIDPMLLKIAEFVVKEQKALIGSILHKFNLSFEDTVSYITQLEKAGILSQYNQNNRTVLVKDISDLPRYL